MKTLRLWLLVVLAVLLPVRGAVAAAMLCQIGAPAVQTEQPAHGTADAHAAMHAHGDAHSHDTSGGSHDHGTADKCHLCSACSSLTPLVSSLPTLAEPAATSASAFPRLSAAAPSFVSDGPERPPRAS